MTMVMMALPFLSMTPALAHSNMQNDPQTMQQVMQKRMQQTSHQHASNTIRQTSMLDCCDQANPNITKDCSKNCAHGEQCNCDSVQIGYTVPIRINAEVSASITIIEFQRSISPPLRAQLNDSLYRPPIAFL